MSRKLRNGREKTSGFGTFSFLRGRESSFAQGRWVPVSAATSNKNSKLDLWFWTAQFGRLIQDDSWLPKGAG
jgi:hypothetical protein